MSKIIDSFLKLNEKLYFTIERLKYYLSDLDSITARLIGYLFAFGTAIITYLIFYGAAVFLGESDPHFIAAALLTTVITHEACHLIACETNHVPAQMFFLAILGGTLPLCGHEDKLENLSWERKSIIVLAGCIGNFICMFGAFCLMLANYLTYSAFQEIVVMNSGLIIWNLIPIWFFDGGRFTEMFFDSLPRKTIRKYAIMLSVGFMAITDISFFISDFNTISLLMTSLFFALGIRNRAKQRNPFGSWSGKAIPESHLKWWATIFFTLIALGAILYALSYS